MMQAPRQLTPFIGRQQELADLERMLQNPACRLLTLYGPGGTGKTRLSLETASSVAPCFADGLYFVPLQAVQSPEFIIPAIADVFGLVLAGSVAPQTQLLSYLTDKSMLLVLDNFEQLLSAEGSDLLLQILKAAPGLKLLVTSRQVLNLQEEWLYPVAGLAQPPDPNAGDWASYDAVKLLVERARRVRWDFSLQTEAAGIVRLCHLVEGMPLALELAATWTKTLSCAEVAAEIQRNLDFLSTTMRDVPLRHRSMQAIFEQAWQQLTAAEQVVFRRLSVFQDGFCRAAAGAVADASMTSLTALLDKSLLRWEPESQRYQVHELLRQFAAGRLAEAPEELNRTQNLHAQYYTTFLGDRFADLTGARQGEALAEIGVELGNVRAAWEWATAQSLSAELEYGAMGLHTFYQYRGRFQEGVEAFTAAVAAVEQLPATPARDRALAMLLTCSGWLALRFGRIEAALAMEERAVALYNRLNILPPPGQGTDPLTALSLLAATRGDYEQAAALGEQANQRATSRADKKNLAFAKFGLAGAALSQGRYQLALQYAQETLALTKAAGNRWFMAYVYNHLGQINQALGNLGAASDYYQASYALKKELDDPEGMALALSYLGNIAQTQGDYQQAHQLYQQSLAIYQKIGDLGGLVGAFQGLGVTAYRLGQPLPARQYFMQALRVAIEAQITLLTLSLLVEIGTYFIGSGAPEQGVALFAFVQQHPACDPITQNTVAELLTSQQHISPAPALAERYGFELEGLTITLLAELSPPAPSADIIPAIELTIPPTSEHLLPEPLTERELEVLQLLGDGLTNQQIAEKLFIVTGTVKKHTSNIYGKLGVSNRTQAAARARELNLI